MDYTEKLLKMATNNGGTVTSSQITSAGIPRTYLSLMEQNGTLARIKRAFYMLPDTFENEMYVLDCSYPKGAFSYGAALYVHGMTDKTPGVYEISFSQKYHFRKNENNLKTRYLTKDVFEFGIENKKSPCQNNIRVYDIEHALCNLSRQQPQQSDTKKFYLHWISIRHLYVEVYPNPWYTYSKQSVP